MDRTKKFDALDLYHLMLRAGLGLRLLGARLMRARLGMRFANRLCCRGLLMATTCGTTGTGTIWASALLCFLSTFRHSENVKTDFTHVYLPHHQKINYIKRIDYNILILKYLFTSFHESAICASENATSTSWSAIWSATCASGHRRPSCDDGGLHLRPQRTSCVFSYLLQALRSTDQ